MFPPSRARSGLRAAPNRRPSCADSVKADREARFEIRLPGFANLADRSTVSLIVADLSYEGCKVDTPVALLPGSRISLSVAQLGVLEATVRWYRNGKAGLSFTPQAAPAKTHQPRQHERFTLKASVTMRRQGSCNYYVVGAEFSRGGCRVEFVERPCVGDLHWLKFEGLEALEVRVRWIDGFMAGVQFTRTIHPAVFASLLGRLQAKRL